MINYCLTKVVMWDIIVTFVSIFTVILFCFNLLIRCPWSNQRYHFGLTISPCTLCHVIVSILSLLYFFPAYDSWVLFGHIHLLFISPSFVLLDPFACLRIQVLLSVIFPRFKSYAFEPGACLVSPFYCFWVYWNTFLSVYGHYDSPFW